MDIVMKREMKMGGLTLVGKDAPLSTNYIAIAEFFTFAPATGQRM